MRNHFRSYDSNEPTHTKQRRTLPYLVCTVLLLLLVSACDELPGDDSQINPPPGTVADDLGFSVRHYVPEDKVGNTRYQTHLGLTDFTTPCRANPGQDVVCLTEVEELDLYFHGVELQYNVPTSMCTYLSIRPYYYYGAETGSGPTTVRVDTDSEGSVGIDSDNDGVIDAPAVTTCQYDYTQSGGPNCCTGDYTRVNRTWGVTSYSGVTEELSWGGSAANCLEGPAMDTEILQSNGFPSSKIRFVRNIGVNDLYSIEAPIGQLRSTNIYAANWYDPADHGGDPPPPLVQEAYEFRCLDRNAEIIARIRHYVREWNTAEDFDARTTLPNNHSVTGNEDVPFGAFPKNDFIDWADLGLNYPGFGT